VKFGNMLREGLVSGKRHESAIFFADATLFECEK
jgi:hypothetical protein